MKIDSQVEEGDLDYLLKGTHALGEAKACYLLCNGKITSHIAIHIWPK